MVRWIHDFFSVSTIGAGGGARHEFAARGSDAGCPVCDHPFVSLSHACISSVSVTVSPYRGNLVHDPIVA